MFTTDLKEGQSDTVELKDVDEQCVVKVSGEARESFISPDLCVTSDLNEPKSLSPSPSLR